MRRTPTGESVWEVSAWDGGPAEQRRRQSERDEGRSLGSERWSNPAPIAHGCAFTTFHAATRLRGAAVARPPGRSSGAHPLTSKRGATATSHASWVTQPSASPVGAIALRGHGIFCVMQASAAAYIGQYALHHEIASGGM